MAGKLRICVLQCSSEGSAGALSEVDPDRKPEVYDTAHKYEWTNVFIRKATCVSQLVELAISGRYDVFMNLCDGAWDEDRAGLEVVQALEKLNLPYTGSDAGFYEVPKVDIKMAVQQLGVQVPAWVHINGLGFGPDGTMGHRNHNQQHHICHNQQHHICHNQQHLICHNQQQLEAAIERRIAEIVAPPECGGLRFPLIVKHPSGYSSVGMTKKSKVTNEGELREQVALLVRQFGGALVEEFIVGREFTVLVVEEPREEAPASVPRQVAAATAANGTNGADGANYTSPDAAAAPFGYCSVKEVGMAVAAAADATDADEDAEAEDVQGPFRVVAYDPVECVFGPGEDFKHFDLKWHEYDTCCWRPCGEHGLAKRLKDAARKTFIATRGVSYGRCDFRVDAAGDVYLLEINANCGMLYPPGLHGSGDYILTLDPRRDHAHFLHTLIASALRRHELRQPKVAREFIRRPRSGGNGGGGSGGGRAAAGEWGLVALAPIRAGEVVQRREGRPATLASRGWLERCGQRPAAGGGVMGGRCLSVVTGEAVPVSGELWAMWRLQEAAEWAPAHHSCDPNTWLEGLDLMARRDIRPGELLTIDFATFHGEELQPFDCHCGSTGCRRRVDTGVDHLAPWLAQRYGSHISPYIAEKRRRASGLVA